MAAHLVQHQHAVLLQVIDIALQALQQYLVMAFLAVAQLRVGALAELLKSYPVAGAFAAGLVVAPGDLQTGALQHIQQAFLVMGGGRLVAVAAHIGKHAGHRHGGFGAAGMHIAKADQVIFVLELGVGLAAIAEQAEVLGAGAFTDH